MNIANMLATILRIRIQGSSGVTVVISYEGLRRNRSDLLGIEWTAVVLDEGQKIRNPDSEITLVAKILSARHRLILSDSAHYKYSIEKWKNLYA